MSGSNAGTTYTIDPELAQDILDNKLFEKYGIEASDRLLGALQCFIEEENDDIKRFLLKDKSLNELLKNIDIDNNSGAIDQSQSYSLENLQKISNYLVAMPEYNQGFPLIYYYFGDNDINVLMEHLNSVYCVIKSRDDFAIFLTKIAENKSIVAQHFDTTIEKYFVVYVNTVFDPHLGTLHHSVQLGYQKQDPSTVAETQSPNNIDESSYKHDNANGEVLFDKFITIFEYTTSGNNNVLKVLTALGDGDDIFTLFDVDKNILQ